MTEAEWLACEDPRPMLTLLADRSGARTWRLFAIESCWGALADDFYYPQLEYAIIFGSALAENAATAPWEDFDRIRYDIDTALLDEPSEALNHLTEAAELTIRSEPPAADDGRRVVEAISAAYRVEAPGSKGDEQFAHQAGLLRELFGNPFRPVAFDPAWRTPDVLLLAQVIYDEKAFDRMPLLADALQTAGCNNDNLLSHCRDASLAHVRGCWVVDAVLGKE